MKLLVFLLGLCHFFFFCFAIMLPAFITSISLPTKAPPFNAIISITIMMIMRLVGSKVPDKVYLADK